MSSQESGIPLWNTPGGNNYRLIELPEELVSLLEGPNAPTLTLESSPTAAILKTSSNGKSYSLRQKNTSNALILLTPADGAALSSFPCSAPAGPAPAALGAIATLHETVELVPETGGGVPISGSRGKWHEKFGKR
ncbi:hypothetical protein VTK73DRAFT_3812 [Phialemonium thermophilum]|uniref:Sister chromatid cohesion protein DCC1 n=1 Tax=Phialemonium thermophilum TaxID=223376 RepID=A0ABR3WY12_9PEZI